MEDGNNFGVTVQMTVAKFLKDTREELAKKLESVASYYSSRADAVDKLGLPKKSTSQTKTESSTESKGATGAAAVPSTEVPASRPRAATRSIVATRSGTCTPAKSYGSPHAPWPPIT